MLLHFPGDTIAQENYTILEDDEYNFSLFTPAKMTLKLDTISLEADVPYIVYSGSYVTEKDTMYYRIDVWENPYEIGIEPDLKARVLVDSTLQIVGDRLGGELLYSEPLTRNSWPGRLARYSLQSINRHAKILLVKRLGRYYLLTVITSPSSMHSNGVNRFLHSFKLYE